MTEVNCAHCGGTGTILLKGSFGNKLRMARKAYGLTLAQAAGSMGFTLGPLYQMETREDYNPTLNTLKAVAAFYDIPISELIEGE